MNGRISLALTCFVLTVSWFATAAAAPRGEELLEEGKKLCAELAYEDCVARLNAALEAGGLSDTQQIEAYRNLGAAYLVLGKRAAAEAAFNGLLRADPSYVLNPATTNPSHLEFFEKVKEKFLAERSTVSVRITHTPPPRAAPEEPVTLSFRVDGGAGTVAAASAHHRLAGGKAYSRVAAESAGIPGEYRAVIPGTFVAEPSLEYYLAATDADGRDMVTFASPADPYTLVVGAKAIGKKRSVLTRWWFWTIGGVVVASAAVTLAVVLAPTQYTVVVDILPPTSK